MNEELNALIGNKVTVFMRTEDYYIGIVTGKLARYDKEYVVEKFHLNTRIGFMFNDVVSISKNNINVLYK